MWDVGGIDAIRKNWKHYVNDTAGVVYVVDSTDRSRMDLAKKELSDLLAMEELSSAAVLVFANKQDLPDAMEPSAVNRELGLSDLTLQKWCVQGSDAVTGNGLYVGLNWMSNTLIKPNNYCCWCFPRKFCRCCC